jgi:DNA-binding FadR family transcriptional regulator
MRSSWPPGSTSAGGPVREAVQRLVREGLLVSTRNRGTSVVDLGPEDIEDVYTARAAIEREAGRLVLRGDTVQLTKLMRSWITRSKPWRTTNGRTLPRQT